MFFLFSISFLFFDVFIFGCAGSLVLLRLFFSGEYSLVAAHGLLTVLGSLLRSMGSRELSFSSCGSQALEGQFNDYGSQAYLLYLEQGTSLCLLHQQADSLPLSHQGGPQLVFLNCPTGVNSVPTSQIQVHPESVNVTLVGNSLCRCSQDEMSF